MRSKRSKNAAGNSESNYDLKDKLLKEILPLMKAAKVDKTLSTSDRNKRARDKAATGNTKGCNVIHGFKGFSTIQLSNDPDEGVLVKCLDSILERRLTLEEKNVCLK
ncbi:unnamed protein product [Allacma fusca]|uniref:Uncharacterized protein n=1 Tax=Allacma fusca TaxID=39272 RepID=A0A8J2LCN0_9HEXA|nr:unnamed protein product [Allacma fusca]